MEIALDKIRISNKISNFSYVFREASVTSIIGRSGSSKSLIGYVLMNLINNYKGRVLVDGLDNYDLHDYLKKVGYVCQNPQSHFICNNVYDEIAYGLRQYKFKVDKLDSQVKNAIKMVGLKEDILDKDLNSLSSGEASLVAIASSMVMNPEVLILDEATIYLDARGKKNLIKLLKLISDKYNKTVIVMSNDMDFVYELGGDYILLDKGNIIKIDKVCDIGNSCDLFNKLDMEIPKIVEFINYVNNRKGIKLENVKRISDISKEV